MYVKLCFYLVFLCPFLLSAQQADTHLNFVVEPYLQQVNDNSFQVLWETTTTGRGFVKLGIAEYNAMKPNLNQSFEEKTAGTFHTVTVTGLKKDAHYFYQALTFNSSGDTLQGPVTPIYIPDYANMPVSFAVIGDTQNSPVIWGKLSELIYQEHPSFLIHVGDLVQNGRDKTDWVDEFFKPAKNLFRFCPFYSAIGNHEQNHPNYYQYVSLPGNEWFYNVEKGDVLFVFTDTNKDILPGSKQYNDLEQILASSGKKWKIVIHHQPVYTSSDNSYGNTWYQQSLHGDPNEVHLKKLYETYGVDLELNGHIHLYERTWPLFSDKVDLVRGVTYITTGGGNDEYSGFAANKAWYDARTRVGNHFLYISIANNKLYGRTIDINGNVFDDWTIEKEPTFKQLNAPKITDEKQYFTDTISVIIKNLNEKGTISYQLNDIPAKTTSNKSVKLHLTETTMISACIQDNEVKSRLVEKKFEKIPVFSEVKNISKQVKADYYEGNWTALPDFNEIKPLKTFALDSVSLQSVQPKAKDHFAVRFTGSFSIPDKNVYRLLLESFDGSKLIIDGHEMINNDGIHYEIKKENFVALEKGAHTFEVQYFKYLRRPTLNIWIGSARDKMMNFNLLVIKPTRSK